MNSGNIEHRMNHRNPWALDVFPWLRGSRHAILFRGILSLILLLTVMACGCANQAKIQAQIRRAYAAGEQAARAQMEQGQQASQVLPPNLPSTIDPQIRIFGAVKNSVLPWTDGLSLARALVEAEYQKATTPLAITIYRNNQPIHIDPQRVLQGEDYSLFPGDIVFIQD